MVLRVIVRMGMAPREASLDYEGLQAHWRSEHADLASQLDGLRSYVQNHAVLEHGRPLFPYVGFDACSELEWDSLEAMDAAFASEHYRRAVVADEHSLIDKSRFLLLLSERRVLQDGEPGDGRREAPDVPPARRALDHRGALRGPRRAVPRDRRPRRAAPARAAARAAGRPRGPAATRLPRRRHPLVPVPGRGARRSSTASSAIEAGYALAGTAFGLERLVARPFRVV